MGVTSSMSDGCGGRWYRSWDGKEKIEGRNGRNKRKWRKEGKEEGVPTLIWGDYDNGRKENKKKGGLGVK